MLKKQNLWHTLKDPKNNILNITQQQNFTTKFTATFTTKFATKFTTKFATTTKLKFNKQGTGEEGSTFLQLHQQSQLPHARKVQK